MKEQILSVEGNRPCGSPLRHQALCFWEIDPVFKCPVVGACLSLYEQKQLLKKACVSSKGKNPYEIHEVLVGAAHEENLLSRRVDRLLKRKYGQAAVSLFQSVSQEEFLSHWLAHLEIGDFGFLVWAAASHPTLPALIRRKIFGRIHMAMHAHAGELGALRRQLASESQKRDRAVEKASEMIEACQVARRESEELRGRLSVLESEVKTLRDENMRLRDVLQHPGQETLAALQRENEELDAEVRQQRDRVEQAENRASSLERQCLRLTDRLENQRKSSESYRQEASSVIRKVMDMNRCDESCPSFDLCQKRILIVGGIERMESLYRDMVEDLGGRLDYHSGHVKGGARGLEHSVRRADMVLCPVNCNSHAACSLVKKLGKKYNVPVHMLSGFSLTSVSQLLKGTAA